MIRYGIYTVKELERFAKGLTPKRKISILSECTKCDFVYDGPMCINCHPWNTVRWRATCPKDRSSSATITCVQRGNSYDAFTEIVWRRDTNLISLLSGSIGNMVNWSSNAKIFTVMRCRYRVSYAEKLWRGLIYVGRPMMVHSGFTVKNRNIFHLLYQPLNRREC